MNAFKKAIDWIAPPPAKDEDGRDTWPSRTSFILAAMGGAVGLGNVLRYPSQVYNNFGAQWFIPYFMAIFLVAIPVLILEVSIGQAYRGGSVVAYNQVGRRLRGLGLGMIINGYTVIVYYVAILGWVMNYWRNGFKSNVPWAGRNEEFFMEDVIANVDPVESDSGWISYPGGGLVPETTGWVLFTWFVIWLCIWRGVGVTGRVV
jgi:solute carrier family 6 (neurotransmitter transporter, GABA) member 1